MPDAQLMAKGVGIKLVAQKTSWKGNSCQAAICLISPGRAFQKRISEAEDTLNKTEREKIAKEADAWIAGNLLMPPRALGARQAEQSGHAGYFISLSQALKEALGARVAELVMNNLEMTESNTPVFKEDSSRLLGMVRTYTAHVGTSVEELRELIAPPEQRDVTCLKAVPLTKDK